MIDRYVDKILNIDSEMEIFYNIDNSHYYRYEPTEYAALEELFKYYELSDKDVLVDFGCGKGRLIFLASYLFKCNSIGIEFKEEIYNKACDNRLGFYKKHPMLIGKIGLINCKAEAYNIGVEENKFYFFNPFSVNVFMSMVTQILRSFEKKERVIDIILYYPSDDYIAFLENKTPFVPVMDVLLPDKFLKDPRERFSIYRLYTNEDRDSLAYYESEEFFTYYEKKFFKTEEKKKIDK